MLHHISDFSVYPVITLWPPYQIKTYYSKTRVYDTYNDYFHG